MKPSRMLPEVSKFLALRHSSEQRGRYSPLGRLVWMETDHGRIDFGAAHGEYEGPSVARVLNDGGETTDTFLLLGIWYGLPSIRINTSEFCPKCLATCEVCGGKTEKLCELCGGNGWTAGNWLPCPGPGCSAETGEIKRDGCETCRGSGQVKEQRTCACCDGKKVMKCPRCRGTGKIATGRIGGSLDYKAAACPECEGSTYKGRWQKQKVKTFRNAQIFGASPVNKERQFVWDVIGPIRSFALQDFAQRYPRIFDVYPDPKNDLLFVLAPASTRHKNPRAYLVGGMVRERQLQAVGA